jgi:hypothetical protein
MNSHPKIKASVVVFDQGNTLLMDPFQHVIELQKENFREIFLRCGIALSASVVCDEWANANKQVNYPFIGHFGQEEPIIQFALRQLEIKEDIAAFLALDLLREYREGLKRVIVSDPRTREVKDTLQRSA